MSSSRAEGQGVSPFFFVLEAFVASSFSWCLCHFPQGTTEGRAPWIRPYSDQCRYDPGGLRDAWWDKRRKSLPQRLRGMAILLLSVPWNNRRRRVQGEALPGHFAKVNGLYRSAAPAVKCTSANPEHREVTMERCTLSHSCWDFSCRFNSHCPCLPPNKSLS